MGGPKYERIERDEPKSSEDRVHIVTAAVPDVTERRDLLHGSLIITSVTTCYFVLSIILTFYNRSILSSFKFPLVMTTYHLLIKLTLSTIVRLLYRCKTGRARILLDWRTCAVKVGLPGLCSGIDIGLGSWGLELITISLYTMTKSTSIIFILIFAILLKLEKKSWNLLLIVVMISGGLVLFNYKSVQFNTFGFGLVLFAAFISGLRWSLAQLIMQKSNLGLHNPIDMVFHMQPWMLLSIFPVMLMVEGDKVYDQFHLLSDFTSNELIVWIFKLSVGAFVAFFMELSEFLTVSYTSGLTLSVIGIFKEICQVVLAVEFNHDQLSSINTFGLVLCLGGIICHVTHKYFNYIKHDDEQQFAMYSAHRTSQAQILGPNQKAPLLDSDALDFSSSNEDSGAENGSNVIFDILKRRDQRR